MRVCVLIAEGHVGLRSALRDLLSAEAGIDPVGEAEDACELLRMAQALHPEVILLDLDLPGLQGFETVRRLSRSLPSTRILLLTDYLEPGLASDALIAGAAGCVVRLTAGSVLVEAILTVGRGQFYIQPEVLRELVAGLRQQPGRLDEQTEGLTPLEADLLRLEARGCTKRQIAHDLGISAHMVDRRRADVMIKLGLRCRADLIRYATALWSSQARTNGVEASAARIDP